MKVSKRIIACGLGLLLCIMSGCFFVPESVIGEGGIPSVVADGGEMTFLIGAALRVPESGESCEIVYDGYATITDCAAGFTATMTSQTDEDRQACEELVQDSAVDFAACIEDLGIECPSFVILTGRYEATSCSGNRGNGNGEGRNNKKGNGKALGHDKNPAGDGQGGSVASTGCMVAYVVEDQESGDKEAVAVILVDDNGEVYYSNCGALTSGSIETVPIDEDCNVIVVGGNGGSNIDGTINLVVENNSTND